MKTIDIKELRNTIYNSRYSDAYFLIRDNIDTFRINEEENTNDIFNREILNYFKSIRDQRTCFEDYQSALLNINFFNREVAFYLLNSGVNIDVLFDPFSVGCSIKDRLICHSTDSEIVSKVISLDSDEEQIKFYNDGEKNITSVGAYLKCGDFLQANREAFSKIKYLKTSEVTESIIDRFNSCGYCLLTDKEADYVHYFHRVILDIDSYLEDDTQKKSFVTMLLYSTDCPFIESETLPMVKSILGSTLYDAYKFHLEKEIEEGKKCFVKVTDYVGNLEAGEIGYTLMEKGLSFSLNVSDESIKEYVKTKKDNK